MHQGIPRTQKNVSLGSKLFGVGVVFLSHLTHFVLSKLGIFKAFAMGPQQCQRVIFGEMASKFCLKICVAHCRHSQAIRQRLVAHSGSTSQCRKPYVAMSLCMLVVCVCTWTIQILRTGNPLVPILLSFTLAVNKSRNPI